VTHVEESCDTCGGVMSHISGIYVTHLMKSHGVAI